jgi:serralysin
LTWEEFQAQAYQDPNGVYVVNGDEAAPDLDRLHDHYLDYLDTVADDGVGSSQQALAVNTVGGFDDLFPSGSTLTYCVAASGSQGFTAAEHSAVTAAMNTAAADWEASANINFVHDTSQDFACDRFNPNVTFDIGRVCTGQFLARAFFPSFPRSSRNILVDCTAFGSIAPFTLAGILKHENGHTIGFRHEHTRPEAGVCFEDSNFRPLTAYDSASVMHYPQCNGTQFGDLQLTSLDRAGANSVYPF